MGKAHRRAYAADTNKFADYDESSIVTPFTTDAPGVLGIDGEKSIVHVYMRSNWTQEMPGVGGNGVIYGEARGLSTNDGLDEYRPIDGFKTLYEKFPLGFRNGARCVVHLADASSPNNGFDGGVSSAPLNYFTDEILVGGGGNNYQSYSYMGPPRMRITTELGTLTNQLISGTAPGAYCILRFGGSNFVGDIVGILQYLYCTNDVGTQLMVEMPVVTNTSTDIWIPDGGRFNGAFSAAATYQLRRPGANIVSTEDYDVLISGKGCYRGGLLQKHIVDPDAQNPMPTFLNLELQGARVDADGISFDRVNFLDHPCVVTGSDVEFRNCRGSGGVYIHGGTGRIFGWRNNTSGNVSNREYAGYQFSDITVASPYVGVDLHLSRKTSLDLSPGLYLGGPGPAGGDEAGHDRGHHSGHMLVYRGISGFGLSTPLVYGTDHSSFAMLDYSSFLNYDVIVGLHVTDYASARVWTPGMYFTGTNTAQLRMGGSLSGGTTGDPQVDETVANFVDASKWNKNMVIHRPHVPANAYGAGVPAATVYPYGCLARIYY